MEVDRITKTLSVPKSSGGVLNPLNPGVDAFGTGVRHSVIDRIDDPFHVFLDHPGHLFDRLHPGADRAVVPLRQRLTSPTSTLVAPSVHSGFFEHPSTAGLLCDLLEDLQLRQTFSIHLCRILQPVVAGPLEGVVAFGSELLVLGAPYLIDCLSQVLGDMELVEADLLVCVGDPLADRRDVALPHIHGHRPDRGSLLFAEALEIVLDHLGFSAIGHMHHVPTDLIADHRHIVVPFLERLFIDADPLRQLPSFLEAATLDPSPDCPFLNAVDRAPAEPEQLSHGADTGFFKPTNHQQLKHGGEFCPAVGPRDLDPFDVVLEAFDARNLRADDGLELAGIQVPPSANRGVVDGARCPTGGARQTPSGTLNLEQNDFLRHLQLDIDDFPWGLQPEDSFIEFGVLHGQKLLDSGTRFHTSW